MAESMIETVARAIRAKVPVGYGMTEDESLDYARAAIEAMREPTDAMVGAGQWEIDPVAMFQNMIDAALNEQVAG